MFLYTALERVVCSGLTGVGGRSARIDENSSRLERILYSVGCWGPTFRLRRWDYSEEGVMRVQTAKKVNCPSKYALMAGLMFAFLLGSVVRGQQVTGRILG